MTISIAMCTYNGGRYLPEQLESFANQTRLPDELIVCDDGSSDDTIAILQKFALNAPFSLTIIANETNLGTSRNFDKAIGLCTSDIIAPSDQDDVWHPEKLARVESAFNSAPQTGMLFTDAEVADENLQPLNYSLWHWARFNAERQKLMLAGHAFDVLLEHNVVTGATMAFRADLRQYLLPIPKELPVVYDAWLGLAASAVCDVTFLPEHLIKYRQHKDQQTGTWRETTYPVLTKEHYQSHLSELVELQKRLMTIGDLDKNAQAIANGRKLSGRIAHLRARVNLPAVKICRIPAVFGQLLSLGYHRYSNGVRSAARDLLHS